ncbi:hypothetical protein [Marivirga sp.]|uniref:hypothetical protein n=1 Tax=Marivirga sp. TaxID=2018662 RepID=UPI002D80CE03|nr:hypothetical protein [Marivirga sp.]HET8860417.1 hypothetical protein [Marivirga sp.]
MKKILSTLFLTIIVCTHSYGQDNPSAKRNFSYVEAGGAGLFFSINYERQLSKTPGFSWRIGLGGYVEGDFYITYNTGLAYLFALNETEDSFIEFGVNYTIAREYIGISGDGMGIHMFENVVPGLSYRKHLENDIILKAGLNAVFNKYTVVPWLNLGFGKRF